uniref:Uncharacterized protein n=1 Tax=Oryza meridionalis TaxID=40149 RepID=A0A0E0F6K3_9ORYZ
MADYKMDQNERLLCRCIDAIIAGRRRDRKDVTAKIGCKGWIASQLGSVKLVRITS